MRPTSPIEAGFTLLEMLVVLTVIAVLSVAAAGRMPMGGPALDRVAAEIARDLRAARAEAMTTGRDVRVVPVAREEVELEITRGEEEVPSLRFYGAGGSDGGVISVARGGAVERISVDWLTGAVRSE